MSFLVAFHTGKAPLDTADALDFLTGEEREALKIAGRSHHVALVISHAGPPSLPEVGVHTLDGRNWLAGQVRLDNRDDLIAALETSGARAGPAISDPGLCLLARSRWGSSFLEHLAGDFSFTLWDEEAQALICARDQLGVRLLYTACDGDLWIFSNSLERLAAIDRLDKRIDPLWVADFLTEGVTRDADRTVYRGVKRVQPAHFVILNDSGVQEQRYWRLEVPEPLYYPKLSLYLEDFHSRLSLAIAARLPEGKTGLSFSGGLDSTTLAAKIIELTGDPSRIVAHTRIFEWLIRDDELEYSQLAAKRLGIRQEILPADDLCYDPDWMDLENTGPEPDADIVSARIEHALAVRMSLESKVWFEGEGPDNALTFEWRPYLRWLWRKGARGKAISASASYVQTTSLAEWRTAAGRVLRLNSPWKQSAPEMMPDWIDPGFVRSVDLETRITDARNSRQSIHPWRPKAHASFNSPIWQALFQTWDSTYSGIPIEWRHPYIDLRVLEFMLRVPPLPWSRHKAILREAMRGKLPREVLKRPKTPLRENPLDLMLSRHPLPELAADSPVAAYVVPARLPKCRECSGEAANSLLKVHALDHWLRRRRYS
jgi:asparagine synthase (glutamine-hydrolysing)